jgi:hypothetical protein
VREKSLVVFFVSHTGRYHLETMPLKDALEGQWPRVPEQNVTSATSTPLARPEHFTSAGDISANTIALRVTHDMRSIFIAI